MWGGGGFKPHTSNTWLRTCMHMNGVMECGWCFYKFLFQVLMLYYWKSWTICSLNLSAKSFYELVVCRLSKAFSFTILGENVKIVKPTIGAFALFFPMLCITSLVHLEYKKKKQGWGCGEGKTIPLQHCPWIVKHGLSKTALVVVIYAKYGEEWGLDNWGG